MSEIDPKLTGSVPPRFTMYDKVQKLREQFIATASILDTKVAADGGFEYKKPVSNFLYFDSRPLFNIELESVGADSLRLMDLDGGIDPDDPVIELQVELLKDGSPFVAESDFVGKFDDYEQDLTDVNDSLYSILLAPEMPPTLVQTMQLGEGGYHSGYFQSANKHLLSDGECDSLIKILEQPQLEPSQM